MIFFEIKFIDLLHIRSFHSTDNKTRVKIGKVVLQPKDNGEEGVQIRSYLNQTYGEL